MFLTHVRLEIIVNFSINQHGQHAVVSYFYQFLKVLAVVSSSIDKFCTHICLKTPME